MQIDVAPLNGDLFRSHSGTKSKLTCGFINLDENAMSAQNASSRLSIVISLAVSALVFSFSQAAAQNAYTTADLNLRTGPSTANPVITAIPARSPVYVYGCLQGRSWCEVQWRNIRGYASQYYLSFSGPSYVPAPSYTPYYRPLYEPYYPPVYVRPPSIILDFNFNSGRHYRPYRRHYRPYRRHYRHYRRHW